MSNREENKKEGNSSGEIEERLKISLEDWTSIFDSVQDAVMVIDRQHRIIQANRATAEIVGIPVSDIVGQTCFRLVHDAEKPPDFCPMKELIRKKEHLETEFYLPDSKSWLKLILDPLCDDNGDLSGAVHVMRDITKRKRAEDRLELANRILEQLDETDEQIDQIKEILSAIKRFSDFDAVGIRLSEGNDFPYYETIGFPVDFVEAERHLCARDRSGVLVRDSSGEPVLECMCGIVIRGRTDASHPFFTDGGSFWTNSTTELLASTTEKRRHVRTRNRCNAAGYESVALIPLKTENKTIGLLQLNDRRKDMLTIDMIEFFEKVGASIGIALNRKRTESALRESRELLRSTIASTEDGILAVDDEGKVIQANERFVELWRIPEKIIATKDDSELLSFVLDQLRKPDAFLAKVQELYNSMEESFDTIEFKDGRIFERFSRPLIIEEKNQGRVWSFRDVTERKKIERMKDEFISTISHELRTPLTSIHGAIGLINMGKTGDIPPKVENLLRIAERNSVRLKKLIDDILDIQKIESGKLEFDFQPLDLKPILEVSVEDVKSFGEKFKVEFVLDDIKSDVKVRADGDRLKQVMNNLLSNAAKYSSPYSSVEVSMKRRNGTIRVEVRDHGPGIPEEFRDKVFDRFTQADSTMTRERSGSGLGLNITKSIIEKLDGEIGFETEINCGTTFYFELPEWKEPKES